MRPLCQACNKNPAAINSRRGEKIYYRARCDSCIRRGRRERAPVPRWQLSGYKKKKICDRCGFVARHASQILVYHINANLNDATLTNLRSVCLNCTQDIFKLHLPWKPGDLEPDL